MTPRGWRSHPADEPGGSYYTHVYHKIANGTYGHKFWCVTRTGKRQYYVDAMGTDEDDISYRRGPFGTLKEACLVAETLEGLKVDWGQITEGD